MSQKPLIRCAIYTRKSSDEGLDQAFNSLDAQHEACAAYIASQRHEGWKLIPERFDDGGLSGGTLDRPALQRLLAEIDAGRIGMVVVYKIDRLTRSLVDFGRLVKRLDAKGCSFVSVTQAFNTATSMGRLTLNVLLSFAQFEREVTAERIRDKIAASKKKGLWMGGALPLGYDRHPDPLRRELVVNATEAEIVQELFRLYGDLGNLRLVEIEAERLRLRPKTLVSRTGRVRGGAPFARGQLHHLLTNPVYIGRIRHKDQTYLGQHPAIIDDALWQEVQDKLIAASARPRGRSGAISDPRVLTGKLRDETGDLLTPTHTLKAGRRFTYYVSNRLIAGGKDPSGWRLPAEALETTLRQVVVGHLRSAASGHALLAQPEASGATETDPMSIRKAEIAKHLTRWLDRFYVPSHLRDKPEACQAEAESLARILCKFAPEVDYVPFLNQVFDQVEFQMKSRAWPTVAELGAACSNAIKGAKLIPQHSDEPALRPVEIIARKMMRSEAVGEENLWGIGAVELIAERLVDEATMRSYRIGAFNKRKATHGEEAALKWEGEVKARHEAAKAVYRARNEPRSPRRVVFPDKSAKPQWELHDRDDLAGATRDVHFPNYENT